MKTTTKAIKAKLDEILSEYLAADAQIEAGLCNGNFYGSDKYFELVKIRAERLTAHHKLTDALVAIETYM